MPMGLRNPYEEKAWERRAPVGPANVLPGVANRGGYGIEPQGAGSFNFGAQTGGAGPAMEASEGQPEMGARASGQARGGLASDLRTLQDFAMENAANSGMPSLNKALLRQQPFGGVPVSTMNDLIRGYSAEGLRQAGGLEQEGMRQSGALQREGMQQAGWMGRTQEQERGATQRAGMEFGPGSPGMMTAETGRERLGLETKKVQQDFETKLEELGLKRHEIDLIQGLRMEQQKATDAYRQGLLGLRGEELEQRERTLVDNNSDRPITLGGRIGQETSDQQRRKYAPKPSGLEQGYAKLRGGDSTPAGEFRNLMGMDDESFMERWRKSADPDEKEFLRDFASFRDFMSQSRGR